MGVRTRIWASRGLAALLACGATAPSAAAGAFDAFPALSSEDLGQERAGYLSRNGINFTFGASLETFVNGDLALRSTLNIDGADQAVRTALAPNDGGAPFDPAVGLTLAGPGGVTNLLQSVGGGVFLNLAATSASNQTIRQSTNLNITLYGFDANQAQYAASQSMRSLTAGLGFTIMASPR